MIMICWHTERRTDLKVALRSFKKGVNNSENKKKFKSQKLEPFTINVFFLLSDEINMGNKQSREFEKMNTSPYPRQDREEPFMYQNNYPDRKRTEECKADLYSDTTSSRASDESVKSQQRDSGNASSDVNKKDSVG